MGFSPSPWPPPAPTQTHLITTVEAAVAGTLDTLAFAILPWVLVKWSAARRRQVEETKARTDHSECHKKPSHFKGVENEQVEDSTRQRQASSTPACASSALVPCVQLSLVTFKSREIWICF